MKWLKDKTYWFCKYNRLLIDKELMENMYTKEIKRKLKEISEIEADRDYYKAKNKSQRDKIKELKENLLSKHN